VCQRIGRCPDLLSTRARESRDRRAQLRGLKLATRRLRSYSASPGTITAPSRESRRRTSRDDGTPPPPPGRFRTQRTQMPIRRQERPHYAERTGASPHGSDKSRADSGRRITAHISSRRLHEASFSAPRSTLPRVAVAA
jgi:hypothetical protein